MDCFWGLKGGKVVRNWGRMAEFYPLLHRCAVYDCQDGAIRNG